MSANPAPDLFARISAWFAENRGCRVKIGVGAYAFDHNEVPEGTTLSILTTIRDSFQTPEDSFEGPTIVVRLSNEIDECSCSLPLET